MPDPIAMLKADHKKVKGLFSEFEKADGRSKRRIVNEAIMELEIHAAIEEEIFYPGVQKAAGEEIMAEAEEEHHVAKVLMAEIKKLEPGDVHYDAKFMVLSENVKHHIQEEEKEMLPKAEKVGKNVLDELGARMESRKQELMKTMQTASPR